MTGLRMIVILTGLLLVLSTAAPASAALPYATVYPEGQRWMPSQAVYVPGPVILADFNEPVDVTFGPEGKAYVVDKGAGQVFVFDREGNQVTVIGSGLLNQPEGAFVTPDGTVYVADSGNRRIALFDAEGNLLREFQKPKTEMLAKDPFVPTKLVVDRRGVMYIVLNASDRGLLRMNPEGEFTGYFGANKADPTFDFWLKNLILTKEQLAKETANLPRAILNVSMDGNGFIYTSSPGIGNGNIKKLNAGGFDAFRKRGFYNTWGIVDLAVDSKGFMYNVDTYSGRITIFDSAGNALFAFAAMAMETGQRGVLGFPLGLAVNENNEIWVADSKMKNIQTFHRTPFGETILNALSLYYQGRYEESKQGWEKVAASNEMIKYTYQGLGRVYLGEGKTQQALEYFRMTFDVTGYSKAFWDLRLQWLQNNLIYLLAVIIAAGAAIRYGGKFVRRRAAARVWSDQIRLTAADVRMFWQGLIHPYSTYYWLKGRKVSGFILILIIALAMGIHLLNDYGTGFIFNPVDTSKINALSGLLWFIIPWITWIAANYLVSSIRGGEGRLREVFQASTYALAPYILFSIPILVLSNIVVLEERVLVDTLNQLMWLCLAVQFFVMTQVIHNFDFLEALGNLVITVLTILIIWFFLFIVTGLTYNLSDFMTQMYREVTNYA